MTTETRESNPATHACNCVHCIERLAAIDADRQHLASKSDVMAVSAEVQRLETVFAQSQTSTTRWVLATVLGFGAIQTALIVGAFMLLTRKAG